MPVPNVQGLMSRTQDRSKSALVFVYGTLKKGFGNNVLLKDADLKGSATIEGLMFHLGGFPAINLSERFSTIYGEVYETDWDTMDRLDALEGHGHGFYDRIQARVNPMGTVWTYIMTLEGLARRKIEWLVPSGMWRGPETPKVRWEGPGKGVAIGAFETHIAADEIKIGPGKSDYILRRSQTDGDYKLVNSKTGDLLGSYKKLSEIAGQTGSAAPSKPRLRLKPSIHTSSGVQQNPAMPSIVALPPPATQIHPNLPIIWSPADNRVKEEPKEYVPQVARLMGYKYGEA